MKAVKQEANIVDAALEDCRTRCDSFPSCRNALHKCNDSRAKKRPKECAKRLTRLALRVLAQLMVTNQSTKSLRVPAVGGRRPVFRNRGLVPWS